MNLAFLNSDGWYLELFLAHNQEINPFHSKLIQHRFILISSKFINPNFYFKLLDLDFLNLKIYNDTHE